MYCLLFFYRRVSFSALVGRAVNKDSRLRNDLYCVEWGVKLYSLTHSLTRGSRMRITTAASLLCVYVSNKIKLSNEHFAI